MDEIGGDPGATFPANGLPGLIDQIDRLIARAGTHFPRVHALYAQGLLRASSLLLGLLGLLLLLLVPPVVGWVLRRTGRLETNFRGDRIPQSYGAVTLLWSCLMFGATAWLYAAQRERSLIWLAACAGFGLLGLCDDLWGTKQIKGLRGHFRAAFRERRITTGFIKAVGGGLLALWLAVRVTNADSVRPETVLAAAIIALSANAINLLDLRPGRAGALFLLCGLPLLLTTLYRSEAGTPPLLLVFLPALRVWEPDARGRVMMGDTGSNLLGGALGLAAITTLALPEQCIVLALLVGLHLLAERRSLTTLIQQSRLLNALDRLTGVR